ncbi:hypothetical protein [Sinosporangium siamense]|uniref:Uncharacterized protein n=1 Tax=Sinosporangium siamense TaxID=1367973 RepID=A0A919RAC1_9ACTN|nr:hypothetical protein [Sinosporangium siamense]GII90053.1 hypothetical protein Ssi02_02840 [Sinosporangium siamense]
MASSSDVQAVLLLDLRGTDPAGAVTRLEEAVAWHRRHGEGAASALVVDAVDGLDERHAVYEQVVRNRFIENMLCLIVGPALERDAGLVLRLPSSMSPPRGAVLWISDPEGVGWRMEPPGPALPYHTAEQGLASLVEVLRAPEVFLRVFTAVCEVPDGVASPGLRVVADDAGDRLLAGARAAAVARLTDAVDDTQAGGGPQDHGGLTVYTGGRDGGWSAERLLRPGGRLAEQDALCARRFAEARDTLARLGGPRGVLFRGRASRRVTGRLAEVRDGLAGYRAVLEDTFDRIDGGSGLDRAAREELNRLGVAADLPEAATSGVVDRLKGVVTAALAERTPLPVLVERLREFAHRATPVGSAAQVGRLAPACPAQLLNRLGEPPPFPLRLHNPVLLAVALAVGFLTGLGGTAAAGAAVALWTVLVWWLWSRAPEPGGERGFGGRGRLVVAVHPLLGALGAAGGRALAEAVRLPEFAVWAGYGAAALAALLALPYWWREAVARWCDLVVVAEADIARSRLTQVAAEVAAAEWVISDARRIASDAARTVAEVLERCAGELAAHEPRPLRDNHAGYHQAGYHQAGHSQSGGVLDAVAEDLAAALGTVLAGVWPRLSEPAFHGLAGRSAATLEGLLADYQEHLARWGVQRRPAFSPQGGTDRHIALRATWPRSAEAENALRMETGDLMLQLCRAEDLALLRSSAGSARLVRFAPAGLRGEQDGLHGDSTDETKDAVWTRSGRHAGVLRLVPPRIGTVKASAPGGEDRG